MISDLKNDDKVWIPLLPGYSILTKKGKYIKLSIDINNNNELQYTFQNFEDDFTFTQLKETKHYNHMFRNFKHELKIAETISAPSLLGFDRPENILYLHNKACENYPLLSNPSTVFGPDEGEDEGEDE